MVLFLAVTGRRDPLRHRKMGSGGEDKEGGVCAQCEIGRVGKLHAWERRVVCMGQMGGCKAEREGKVQKLIKEGFGGGVNLIQGD